MAEVVNLGSRGRISTVPSGPVVPPDNALDQYKARRAKLDPAEFRPPLQERYCVSCRGPHDQGKLRDPSWEPYSIKKRMGYLGILETNFYAEMKEGRVPARIDGDKPNKIVWILKNNDGDVLNPAHMTQEDYLWFLPLMFEGCREQHEPHRYIAYEAAKAMISSGGTKLLKCIPYLIRPLSIGLQTMEPNLAAVQLDLLKRMIEVNRWMAEAFVPYLRKILPPVLIFKYRRDLTVFVPPPQCTAATGTRSGRGAAMDAKACNICGKLIDPDAHHAARKAKALQLGFDPPPPLKKKNVTALPMHRPYKRYNMSELIADVLMLMEDNGGEEALREIRKFAPSWGMGSSAPAM